MTWLLIAWSQILRTLDTGRIMKKETRFSLIGLHVLALIGMYGCYSVPETGRSSLNLVSDSAMVEMSKQQFVEYKSMYRISNDYRYNAMVQRVGERIAEATQWDILNPEWEFVVFDNDEMVNAFALAGGKVGIFTGLFKVVQSDEDLAIVLGHEIAHISARHIHERLSREMVKRGLGVGISVAMGGAAPISQVAINNAYGLGSALGGLAFDRKMESEADKIGLMYAAKAGYDPRVAIEFWERMMQLEDREAPSELLSTHPSDSTRLADLHAAMPEAVERYERVKSGGPAEDIIIIE